LKNFKKYRKAKQEAEVKVYTKLMANIYTKQQNINFVPFFFEMFYARQVTAQKYSRDHSEKVFNEIHIPEAFAIVESYPSINAFRK